MGKTFIQTFKFNYDISSSGQDYNHLEDLVTAYMEGKNLAIMQIEFLWGNQYGARIAVLFKELT